MPMGKPAGVRCVQLDEAQRCRLFGQAGRPAVCVQLKPAADMCGDNAAQAEAWLARLEHATAPLRPPPTPSPQATRGPASGRAMP